MYRHLVKTFLKVFVDFICFVVLFVRFVIVDFILFFAKVVMEFVSSNGKGVWEDINCYVSIIVDVIIYCDAEMFTKEKKNLHFNSTAGHKSKTCIQRSWSQVHIFHNSVPTHIYSKQY